MNITTIPTTKDGRGRHNFKNLLGLRFGRLSPISLAGCRKAKSGLSMVYWLCKCDCGQEKELRAKNLLTGRVKSCGCLCREVASFRARTLVGEKNNAWKGGRSITWDGYVILSGQTYPGKKRRSEREHIIVMSRYLGRPLKKGESVHHKNGIRDDNRIENLELWSKKQLAGQRTEDLVVWAKEVLARYCPEALR